jgi:hypothetical protein
MQSDETFTIAADCTTEGRTSTKAKRVQLLNAAVAPHSYKSYSRSELKNNQIVSHFRSNLLEENRHLKERLALLQPTNEYNVPKLACTTLRPTLLPETELYDLRHCAEFVSRYVDFETVSTPSNEYTVVSPTQTIAWAKGDCFDVSFLLASLLLGNGYDAFVCFGTAPKWIRKKEQAHMKYLVEQREVSSNLWGLEMIISDDTYSKLNTADLGVHCWVFVKPGRRELVGGPCFVEPSTGILYPFNAPYTDIYAMWNDKNYWVNVDDDASIVKESAHDLTNSDRWRQVFPTDSEAPYSWVDKLKIPRDQFLLQYPPNGRRCILLDQAKVELFGDNVDPQGVVARIIQYEDSARTIVLECTELFSSKRNDHLLRRTRKPMFMMHHEFFSPMNEFSISERKDTAGVQRSINFYQKTRVDGLLKRVEDVGNSITEIFHARSDGLVRRIVYIKELPKDEKKPKHSEVITLGIGNGVAVLTRIE